MTRQDIAGALANNEMPKDQVDIVLGAIFDSISHSLKEGKNHFA
jgi:hypothetical protein